MLELPRAWEPPVSSCVARYCHRIVFLLETKLKKKRMERVRDRMGFANGLLVPSRGYSGGLALLWKREVNLNVKSFSNFPIDATVTETNTLAT